VLSSPFFSLFKSFSRRLRQEYRSVCSRLHLDTLLHKTIMFHVEQFIRKQSSNHISSEYYTPPCIGTDSNAPSVVCPNTHPFHLLRDQVEFYHYTRICKAIQENCSASFRDKRIDSSCSNPLISQILNCSPGLLHVLTLITQTMAYQSSLLLR
jgi:hypothetical protein